MYDFTIDVNEYLPLRDVVFSALRRAILMGELKPGERLMEVQLTQKLGVSRTPIREAIRMLEKEGLVKMVPRRGASVASITEKDLQDVLEVRCALEELAVELACTRITREELNELQDSVAAIEKVIKTGDVTVIAEEDVRFHDIIFAATGNTRLIQMLNNLREQMYRYRIEYLKDSESHKCMLEEHKGIIKCLEERQKEEAKSVIRQHIMGQVLAVSRNIRNE